MPSRWFRLYDELLDDPKVQKLPAEDFRGWVNLLCLTSKNEGRLPPPADIAFALRETQEAVSMLLERLRNAGLIVRRRGGNHGAYDVPHKWEERQYKSDTSTERVKRFRQRSKQRSKYGDETPPESESEKERKKKESAGGRSGLLDGPRPPRQDGPAFSAADRARMAADPDGFWADYQAAHPETATAADQQGGAA